MRTISTFLLILVVACGQVPDSGNLTKPVYVSPPLSLPSITPKAPDKLKVMVIDNGLNTTIPLIRRRMPASELVAMPVLHHGTEMAYLAMKDSCDGVEFYFCAIGESGEIEKNFEASKYHDCLEKAVTIGPDILSLSLTGNGTVRKEVEAIFQLSIDGTTVLAAAGNEGMYVNDVHGIRIYPAMIPAPNLVAIGAMNNRGERASFSNWGIPGMIWEQGVDVLTRNKEGKAVLVDGTSPATAIVAGKIVKQWCERYLTK